ncbi:MAG: hypothetical protein GWM87_03060, partial [Xanthomonadales bacterium]|nr:hypothetical protein [Xanthomonadales bacterium]NIX12026.1 hypothetical protein [Xanthomonadales bacterium]
MPNATRPRAGVLAIIMFMSMAMVMAANAWQPVNWDRGEAVRVAAQTDTFATREALRQLALAGDGKELLDLLQSTSTRPDWPLPARENVLHDFAESLRGMPPGSVSPEVMGFLGDYRSQVLIARAEHPVTGVAMYNIRSVAHGVQHTWDRQEAAFEGAALLGRDPLALVGRFDSAGPAARQGYLDALDTATPGQ